MAITHAKYMRFKDAVWFDDSTERQICLVGGAGGISSWLTLMLERAGFKVIVYDFDILEEHNLGGQLFKKSQIGKLKVQALKEVVKDFTDEELMINSEKYTSTSMGHYICFAGFDNMEARKSLFENWVEASKLYMESYVEGTIKPIFIDGRLLAEQLQIICVPYETEAINHYMNEYMFNDSDVQDASCTFKQTSHVAAMIASLMVAFFTNHISNSYLSNQIRTVPFFTEYYIPLALTTTTLNYK